MADLFQVIRDGVDGLANKIAGAVEPAVGAIGIFLGNVVDAVRGNNLAELGPASERLYAANDSSPSERSTSLSVEPSRNQQVDFSSLIGKTSTPLPTKDFGSGPSYLAYNNPDPGNAYRALPSSPEQALQNKNGPMPAVYS